MAETLISDVSSQRPLIPSVHCLLQAVSSNSFGDDFSQQLENNYGHSFEDFQEVFKRSYLFMHYLMTLIHTFMFILVQVKV